VQLLCSEIVHLKNDGPAERRLLVTEADVEAAVPNALMAGDMFFADMANQAGDSGEALLRTIAAAGEGATLARTALASIGGTELNEALTLLLRRDAIERDGEGYRFQVELIRRWFAA
jgi:hypothetical protein